MKLKRGDRCIVARPQAFSTQRQPRQAIFWQAFAEGSVAVMFPDHDHPVHFHATDVAPYSDALWTAWERWLQNAEILEDQQKQLRAGRMPQGLLAMSLFD